MISRPEQGRRTAAPVPSSIDITDVGRSITLHLPPAASSHLAMQQPAAAAAYTLHAALSNLHQPTGTACSGEGRPEAASSTGASATCANARPTTASSCHWTTLIYLFHDRPPSSPVAVVSAREVMVACRRAAEYDHLPRQLHQPATRSLQCRVSKMSQLMFR